MVIHYSTDDITGGAAKAAHRLHSAMRQAGHDSWMVVRNKKSNDPYVEQVKPYALNLQTLLLPSKEVNAVYLHWVDKLLNAQTISYLHEHYRCPMIWIPADLLPMTGGCNYTFGCNRFKQECGCCPQVPELRIANNPKDRTNLIWQQKRNYLKENMLCFAAPTGWIAKHLRESSLFNSYHIEIIPYAIDTKTFCPANKQAVRETLRIPTNKKVIFFGSTDLSDFRKGMALLKKALNKLATIHAGREVFLLIAGNNGHDLLDAVPFDGKCLGYLSEDLILASAYQAADLFICPSIEDAGPMMLSEAMLCGVPVVAFNTGSAPDLIRHRQNGYLAILGDSDDLAQGIKFLLDSDKGEIGESARKIASAFHDPAAVVAKHLALVDRLGAQTLQD